VDPDHDLMSALQQWVTDGVPPQQFIGTKYVNDDPRRGIALQRLICAFPAEPVYTGRGATTDPGSYRCDPKPLNDEWQDLE
jgi:feruloyl esterase